MHHCLPSVASQLVLEVFNLNYFPLRNLGLPAAYLLLTAEWESSGIRNCGARGGRRGHPLVGLQRVVCELLYNSGVWVSPQTTGNLDRNYWVRAPHTHILCLKKWRSWNLLITLIKLLGWPKSLSSCFLYDGSSSA